MIRERITKFMAYTGTIKSVKRSFAGVLGTAFGFSFLKDPLASTKKYDSVYDLAVIGGGSGGLATAFQANQHGLNVIVIDYVEQSLHRTKWGLGGTCVNVGCIPKKLMHQAAKAQEQIIDASDYGWDLEINDRQQETSLAAHFNWKKLRGKIQGYIKSINFGYVANVNKEDNLEYLNCLATFKDKETLLCSKNPQIIRDFIKTGQLPPTNKEKPEYHQIKAKTFVIATGTRPSYLKLEGAQHAITSDDIFNKKQAPGKTLIVGGGYVAVQIAGFLRGMGFDVSLMTRGDYLRSFDRDMVRQIITDLKKRKVNIVDTSLPVSIKKKESGKLEVHVQNQVTKEIKPAEEFDTVLFAVGRTATTDNLNLKAVGVETVSNKKIKTHSEEIQKTSVENIYALGDVVDGLPELTSTATKMGWHLGRRITQILGKGKFPKNKKSISLQNYPTTIFTPLEYSCCGLSEELAMEQFGHERISVYHIKYTPLEENVLDKYNDDGSSGKTNVYAKCIVHKESDKVIGLHYAGPHAGQVMQGFAVAVRIGMTKEQLDSTIGIHPTSAEELTNMKVTKESGLSFEKTSC